MKFKVCGMRDPKNIESLTALKPDYMGFIFWEPSARYVSSSTPLLPPTIKKTGVFVDASFNYIKTNIEVHQLQAIQLHGKESPDFCKLTQSLGVEVIKAFGVAEGFKFSALDAYENYCDYYLFDTKGKLPGGNGYSYDWEILKKYLSKKPFFLSGGIDIEHIPEIHKLLNNNLPLYAVDVNSKFESEPGLKKIDALTQFKNKLYEL